MKNNKKDEYIKLFYRYLPEVLIFNDNFVGSGIKFQLKRLLKYRINYLKCGVAQVFNLKLNTKVETFWGRKMIMPLFDAETMRFVLFKMLSDNEHQIINFLIKNLKNNDVFYDIGANYGFYSALAADLISGKVHSFEPNSDIYEYSKTNFSDLTNLKLNKVALSNKDDMKKMFVNVNSSGSGTLNSIVVDKNVKRLNVTMIKTIKLDDYIKNHDTPTIIKLDVEGAEEDVLLGAQEFLSFYAPLIIMEVWGGENGVRFSKRAVDFLYSFGFKSFMLNEEGDLNLIEKIDFDKIKNSGTENYIFIKENDPRICQK